jgi:hypothetical protein
VVLLAATCSVAQNSAKIAPTPPLGWNSWDAYGLTINETDYRANTTVLAGLKEYGWTYSVIDEGWYMQDPFAETVPARKYVWDQNGILIPSINRFPSSQHGAGFKPLADWVHAQGMKFGIHIVRGIPRQVVKENLPIANSSFRATDAADTTETCPWDEGNYGVRDTPAGQAYYDSMMKLYAGWGLDYIKVDCISDHPYRPTEIRQIALAIERSGRPIVLSLSPGPTQLQHAAEVGKSAQLWRISDDHWDVWASEHKNGGEFPFGVRDAFDRLAQWQPHVQPGNWPDADMLPIGSLTPHPGWGEPRESRETHDEAKTEFSLWAIARSPLILGANLTKLDPFTQSLITNRDILYMHQHASSSGPVDAPDLRATYPSLRIWQAHVDGMGNGLPASKFPQYFAFFNLGDTLLTLHTDWKHLGLPNQSYASIDLWTKKQEKPSRGLELTLPPHGSAIFKVM